MKKIFYAVSACILSIVLFAFSVNLKVDQPEEPVLHAEALAPTEEGGSGVVIYCYCSKATLFANKECLASNHGNRCAQSEPGGNITCNFYDSNCGSH